MAESIKITAKKRTTQGSREARRLRRAGVLPASVSSAETGPESIELDHHEFKMLLSHHGRDNLLADLKIDRHKPTKVLLKEVQYHPVSGNMLHADFVAVSMTQKMRVSIPVRLVGDCAGVLQEGGTMEQNMREMEVECLPGEIVDAIEVDVTALAVGQSIHVEDVQIPEELSLLTSADLVVAHVRHPIVEDEETPEDGAGEEGADGGAEPELIREKKEEEDSAGDKEKS